VDTSAALSDVIRRTYVPALVLAHGAAGAGAPAVLRDRSAVDGRSTAYVCRAGTCQLPTHDTSVLAQQLRTAVRLSAG